MLQARYAAGPLCCRSVHVDNAWHEVRPGALRYQLPEISQAGRQDIMNKTRQLLISDSCLFDLRARRFNHASPWEQGHECFAKDHGRLP